MTCEHTKEGRCRNQLGLEEQEKEKRTRGGRASERRREGRKKVMDLTGFPSTTQGTSKGIAAFISARADSSPFLSAEPAG